MGNFVERIASSIAPRIVDGYDDVKKVLALQLVGGVQKRFDDGSIKRGNINVGLIGDLGTYKTHLLKYVVYLQGNNALYDQADTLKKQDLISKLSNPNLQLYALDNIDVLHRLSEKTLKTIVEQQEVKGKPVDLSLLAAGNPASGGDFYKGRKIWEDINLTYSLMDVFDIIYILRKEKRVDISDDAKPSLSPEKLMAQITRLRKLEPIVNKSMKEKIKQYADKRMAESARTSNRFQHTVLRFCEAYAKLRDGKQVTEEDLWEVGELLNSSCSLFRQIHKPKRKSW